MMDFSNGSSIEPLVLNAKGSAFYLDGQDMLGDCMQFRFVPPREAADGHYDIYFFKSGMMVTIRTINSAADWFSSDLGDSHTCFCFHLRGTRRVEVLDGPAYSLDQPSFVTFQQPAWQLKHMSWGGGDRETSVTISTTPALLEQEFGFDSAFVRDAGLFSTVMEAFSWSQRPLMIQMATAAEQLLECGMLHKTLRPAFIRAKASELLCYALQAGISRHQNEHPKLGRSIDAAAKAALIIDNCHGVGVSLTSLAGQLGVHPTSICRSFKMQFGETIFRYSERARMKKAKLLLVETDLGIKQISHLLSYGSASSFSVAFKRFSGLPPENFREALLRGRLDA